MSNTKKIVWSAWLIASIFYAYQNILRVMPNIMLTDIMQQFNIDAALYGQFSGAYYIGYCLIHLPIGIMLDRFGPKKVMTVCILLTVIGLLPIIFATHWIYPIIGRFLIGVGSSAAILGAFKIIRMTFKEEHFTRMLSFSVTIGLIGAIYGGVPVSYFSKVYGYETVVEVLAVMGVVFALITYMLVPESKEVHSISIMKDIKTVFSNPKVLLTCLFAGLMVGPMEGFADAWGSEFLKQVYCFDTQTANSLTSMIYIGMCFAPVLSRIAEKTNAYIETIAGAGILMCLSFIMLVMGMLNFISIMISLFIVGVCCAYQIIAIYKASTYVPEHVSGLTTAVANMIIMSFGYVFHSGIGLIIKHFSDIDAKTSYIYGVSIVPFALLIGVVGFIVLCSSDKNVAPSS
jgi:predicted MFS family arabinose efflux permease